PCLILIRRDRQMDWRGVGQGNGPRRLKMEFLHDSLLPENQEKLVIQAAPFGPTWLPEDSDDIPISLDDQVQRALDCYNAGATVLHVHVREEDGSGSKRLARFNEA